MTLRRTVYTLGLALLTTVAPRIHAQASCPAIVHQRFGFDAGFFEGGGPPNDSLLASAFRDVIYADTVDLDCDGRADLVAQGLPIAPTPAEPLTLFVWVRRDSGWKAVLRSVSPVAGPEKLVIAAPLASSDRRDLLVMGADEGGYVPRGFRWAGDTMVSVHIPAQYVLRHEPDWSRTCARKRNPQALGDGRITLLRETLSPSSTRTHGEACALPTDTLRIIDRRLLLVHE